MSVVAEVEERSQETTPTGKDGVGSIQGEESTESTEWEGDSDTLPLI